MRNKKLVLISNGNFDIEENDLDQNKPIIDENLILVSPINVGICSSDIPRAFNQKSYFYPLVLGHEFCVSIIKDPLNKIKKNQRCAVFPLLRCFKCPSCRKRKYNMCKDYLYYGSRLNGGMQEIMQVKRWNLIPIPDSLSDSSASLIEPISVCLHASKKVKSKSKVLILGGGFLSQILSQLLISNNCQLFCFDRNSYKKKFFSNNVFFSDSITDFEKLNFDIVIECCGAEGMLSKCIDLVKPGGTVIQMANPTNVALLDSKSISNLMRKEIKIIGTWNSEYRPDDHSKCDWRKTIKLLENDSLCIKNLISHKVELSQAIDLFNKIYTRKTNPECILGFNKAIIEITPD